MNDGTRPFEFKNCIRIVKSTGKKASDLRGLQSVISAVSEESLFHHTFRYFLKRQVIEFNNDFAQWAANNLEERALAEYFSNIDPFTAPGPASLRGTLLAVIDDYLKRFPEPRPAIPGDEFHFNESLMILSPAGLTAHNMAEFLIAVRHIDASSIYYHFYESRARLGGVDDFSNWAEAFLGRPELAARIRAVDPLTHTLEGVRERIVKAVDDEVRRDMEAAS